MKIPQVNVKGTNSREHYEEMLTTLARMCTDVPRPLTNDLWVFLFKRLMQNAYNEPVRLEHICMSRLL